MPTGIMGPWGKQLKKLRVRSHVSPHRSTRCVVGQSDDVRKATESAEIADTCRIYKLNARSCRDRTLDFYKEPRIGITKGIVQDERSH